MRKKSVNTEHERVYFVIPLSTEREPLHTRGTLTRMRHDLTARVLTIKQKTKQKRIPHPGVELTRFRFKMKCATNYTTPPAR